VSQRKSYQFEDYQEIVLWPEITKDGQEIRRGEGNPTIPNGKTSDMSQKIQTAGMLLFNRNFIE